MKNHWLSFLLLSAPLTFAATIPKEAKDPKESISLTPWRISLIPLAATTYADMQSSHGLVELNPIMGRGIFGWEQTRNKTIAVGVMVGIEYLVVKKWPKSQKVLRWVNFGYSGVTGVVVVRNIKEQSK